MYLKGIPQQDFLEFISFPLCIGLSIIKYFIHEGFLLSGVNKILYYARLSNKGKMANSEKEALYYFIVIGWQGGRAVKDNNLWGVENFFYSFLFNIQSYLNIYIKRLLHIKSYIFKYINKYEKMYIGNNINIRKC